MADFQIISRLTVADFKSQNGNNNIDIKKNPKTNGFFFTCGSVTGAVSKKLDPRTITADAVEVITVQFADGNKVPVICGKQNVENTL